MRHCCSFDIQSEADKIALDYFKSHSKLPDPPEIEHDCENIWSNLAPYLQTGIITQDLIDWIAPCDECLKQVYKHIRSSKLQRQYMLDHQHDRFGPHRRKTASILKRQIERANILFDLAMQIIPDKMYIPRQQTVQRK